MSGVATCAISNALAGTYSAHAQFTDTDGLFSNSASNTDSVTVPPPITSPILQTSPANQTVQTTGEAAIISAITTNDTLSTVVFTPSSYHGLTVNASGAVTTSGLLAQGAYTLSGSTSDSLGGAGKYSFTLHVISVAILQTSPTSQTVLTTRETAIISTITTNDTLAPATFTTASYHGLTVNASGVISVAGLLGVNVHVSGSTSDRWPTRKK